MRALVTVSSKHGGTDGIGHAIAAVLESAGIQVDVIPPSGIDSLDEYDAVVVGSALYMGRWMGPAREFIQGHADDLRRRPVWLFASGPVTGVADDPYDAAEGLKLRELIGARDFRVFAGKLERNGLGFAERAIVRMIKSPWGDYRPWGSIREWAASIATAISRASAGVTSPDRLSQPVLRSHHGAGGFSTPGDNA